MAAIWEFELWKREKGEIENKSYEREEEEEEEEETTGKMKRRMARFPMPVHGLFSFCMVELLRRGAWNIII